MSNIKAYSGVDQLPRGTASDAVIPGCIVLEGGAFRAIYESGVLDVLMEAGINLACIIGVSAGALNGMSYVSGQIGRAAHLNLRYRHDKRYVGLRPLPENRGIIGFDFMFTAPPGVVPFDNERFFDPKRRFIAVATNCLNGETVYFDRDTCGDIYTAVKASASMPYVSKMVTVDGIPCLDGGCSTKLAYEWPLKQNFEKIIIVRTRPSDWRYPLDKTDSAAPQRFYHKYPQLARSISDSEEKYNNDCDEITRLAREGRVFVISPSADLHVERLERDMEKLGASYYMGRTDAQACLDALKEYLGL